MSVRDPRWPSSAALLSDDNNNYYYYIYLYCYRLPPNQVIWLTVAIKKFTHITLLSVYSRTLFIEEYCLVVRDINKNKYQLSYRIVM